MSSIAQRAVVAFFGLIAALLGLWAINAEGLARPWHAATSLQRLTATDDLRQTSGVSTQVQNLALLDCENGLRSAGSLEIRYYGDAAWERVARNCLALADNLSASQPTYSFAWFVGAFASAVLGDKDGMNERLLMSHETGPFEQWVAEKRVYVSERFRTDLTEDLLARNDNELELLVRSTRGIVSIAARYVFAPDFRERITTIVEKLPMQDQQRFVATVRRQASGR